MSQRLLRLLVVEHLLQDRRRDGHVYVLDREHADRLLGLFLQELFERIGNVIHQRLDFLRLRLLRDDENQARLLVIPDLRHLRSPRHSLDLLLKRGPGSWCFVRYR